jgi:hypothetical protein
MQKLFALAGIALLAGCSLLQVPVNLVSYLGAQATGSYSYDIPSGSYSVNDKLPNSSGRAADFTDVNLPVTLTSASLDYGFNLGYQGDTQLSGDVMVQLYMAPAGNESTDSLWQDKYKLGASQTVAIAPDQTNVQVAGQVTLGADQLRAVNQRKMRFGVIAQGNGSSTQAAHVVFNYEVQQLVVKVGVL